MPSRRLAIHGGDPVRTRPMPRRIQVGEAEIDAVQRVMRQAASAGGGFDRYGLGVQARGTSASGEAPGDTRSPDAAETHGADQAAGTESEVVQFERELAAFHGVAFVDAVSSGTAAAHSVLAALALAPGDEVITSPLTDPGVVMAILLVGAVPVFADHDAATALMSAATVEAVLSPRTRAVVVTHLMGLVADVPAIREVAGRAGATVIADVAQAHAVTLDGSRRAPLGDAAFSSLMATKHITAGGQGGFVATDDEALHWAVKRFADRGKPFGIPPSPEDRQHGGDRVSVGLNYRMADLGAAMGRVQLARLPAIAARRAEVYGLIGAGIADRATVEVPRPVEGSVANPWAAVFRLRPERSSVALEAWTEALTAEGVPATPLVPGMVPVADELAFVRTLGSRLPAAHHPVVDRLAGELFVIWIHEGWTEVEVADAIHAFEKVDAAFRR